MINQQQLTRLVTEFKREGNLSMSAMKAGMDPKTARKYVKSGAVALAARGPRPWRTRTDPLNAAWARAEGYLRAAPELEATALFEHLLETAGDALKEGQLRTFQGRVRQWRLEHGPDPEVIFAQEHRPGEVLQVDWTHAKELVVTIAGQPLDHRFCHVVLPYSNWQWATRCQSESLLSVRQGLQAALHRLGKVPGQLQIDNSSAATHQISVGGIDQRLLQPLPTDAAPPFPSPWVFGRQRQEAVVDEVFGRLTDEKSLALFYTKEGHPLGDGIRRLVVGIGRITKVGKREHYDTVDGKPGYPLWDRVISHSIRPDGHDGFLLPYPAGVSTA